MDDIIAKYLDDYINLLTLLPITPIRDAVNLLKKTKGMVYVCGNGGSFAMASHFASDLTKLGFIAIRLPVTVEELTAVANDTGYENIFADYFMKYFKKKDILICISSSGNSPNIVKVVECAKANNIPIIGISGFDGGRLNKLADIRICIQTKEGEYGLAEGIHSVIHHTIIECLKSS